MTRLVFPILCGERTVIERENNVRGLTGEAKNFRILSIPNLRNLSHFD
jgi:hypothetical protein